MNVLHQKKVSAIKLALFAAGGGFLVCRFSFLLRQEFVCILNPHYSSSPPFQQWEQIRLHDSWLACEEGLLVEVKQRAFALVQSQNMLFANIFGLAWL